MNSIVVTGDFLVDYHIYEGQRHHFGDQHSRGVCVQEELGGAALIHKMLEALQAADGTIWQSVLAVDPASALDTLREFGHGAGGCVDQPFASYAFWRPYPLQGESKQMCWRVAESMGFGGKAAGTGQWPWKLRQNIPTTPQVLVISDGGMGFRSRTNVANWNLPVHDQRLLHLFRETGADCHPGNEPEWIVLKMSHPVAEGDLWRELSHFHAQRLVVVVSASELRRSELRVGMSLSWEQTLEDLRHALKTNASLKSLLQCRHLIISFDVEGTLWLDHDGDSLKATFLFDAEYVEGERRQAVNGEVSGLLSCLTTTVSAELASAKKTPDLEMAIRRGIAAMRRLRELGHGSATDRGAGFPAKALAEAANRSASSLHVRSFQCDDKSPVKTGWSLLALHESPVGGVPLWGIARRVLIQGPHSLCAPTLNVGDFFTADRTEIEALRSLRQLVRRYVDEGKGDKPLSIGVFGPPGAGKSFAVKELARSLLGNRSGWLEFNLSQFNGPADLIGALHQVRDKNLEGKIPVAFFDEFDSQNLEWLKFLLAPMQDGHFQEGQISHPVGQCLFVFAGGTSHTFEEFLSKGDDAGKPGHEAADHFVLSKGPDFASRLDGKLNVVGPNPRRASSEGGIDIFYPVRRALFIRSRLRCKENERLKIHAGLATALLEVPCYKHGARSLTKLLEPFRALRRGRDSRPLALSTLPPRDQLALQVTLSDFEALVRRDEENADKLGVDKLAGAVHAFYREKAKSEGWIKPHHDCEFRDLAPFDQASNRAAARRIPAVLALAGLKLEPGCATDAEREQADAQIAFHKDVLAEAEHDGWMDWHFDNGWTQAPPGEKRDDFRLIHDRLVPYSDLPIHEQKKDQDSVCHYPSIAELAGLRIVPTETTGSRAPC